MKRIVSFIFLISLLLTACTNPSTPVVEEKAVPSPSPYPDTPSPPEIDAPVVETPAIVFIDFLNSLDGWALTETQVVRTNDGGITWYNVSPQITVEDGFNADFFVLDTDHAWVNLPDFNNYPNGGVLYRTSDGGLTWSESSSPFSNGHIQFLDANNGWALADLGVGAGSNAIAVHQTTDGGVTWTQKYINDPNNANAGDSLPLGGLKDGIAPVNMQTAFVYGITYASGVVYLYRTDDGGANWSEVSLPLPVGAENFELGIDADQMKFVTADDGYIVVRMTGDIYQAAIYSSHDGGKTWELTLTPIPEGGSAVFLSAEEMVIYNGAQFYVTKDAARTWRIIPPDVDFSQDFIMMDFVDPNTGWVVTIDEANQYSLYRTGDGGGTWSPIVP